MSTPTEEHAQLQAAIASLEGQRLLLGDATVDLAIAALRQQLAAVPAHPPAAGTRHLPVPRSPSLPSPSSLEAEWKLVTVMFADLSGFTRLAERLGAEQVRGLINACFDRLVPLVEKYGGTLDKFLGDGLLAVFGAPAAHENDPERALRAALEMQEAMAAFNREHGPNLELHFGINTGMVVAGGIGSAGRQEYGVTGDAVNVASRLEEASERDEIFVGQSTYRLTAALFDFEVLPPISVKGKTAPVPLYRLKGARPVPGAARGLGGLRSPLVGRDTELRQLRRAFRSLGRGLGGVLAVAGEAGVGKSRLVAEARGAVPTGVRWVEGRALSHAESISYWVAQDLLRSLAGVDRESPPGEVAAALREQLATRLPAQVAEVHPYLARLLDAPLEDPWAERVRFLSPDALQQRMTQAFCDLARDWALQEPLVLVWEDLHWADPSSLRLLEALLAVTAEAPLFLLLLFRPHEERVRAFEGRMRKAAGKRYARLALQPLTPEQSTQLLNNLLRIENLPEATRERILTKAEGNAFFLEELLRSLIDAGLVILQGDRAVATGAIETLEVPDTLQGVIAARIDRLPAEDKRLLQTASVIGRIFQQRVLGHLWSREAAEKPLDPLLVELQRRELIHLRTGAAEPGAGAIDLEYIFKHAVTQDVTYASLLQARRRALHQATGEAIEALFPERLEELSATLAYHYEKAEAPEKAIRYLTRAAERAAATYANTEALTFYRSALEQVSRARQTAAGEAPGAAECDAIAARLHEGLGDVLELLGQHEEARACCENALSLLPSAARVHCADLHRKAGMTHTGQFQYDEALGAYARAEAALGGKPPEEDVEALREWAQIQIARLSVHYFTNQIAEATALLAATRPVIERSATPAQRARFFNRLSSIGLQRDRYVISDETLAYSRASLAAAQESGDPAEEALARFLLGVTLLWRGELDEARERLLAARELAERIGDFWIQTVCFTYLGVLHRKRGEVTEVRRYAPRALTLATRGAMPQYVGWARANQAWVAWREGDPEEAGVNGRAALDAWSQLPVTWMFQWGARWPLLGVALVTERVAEAIEQARALLTPDQHRMPDALAEACGAAVQAWEADETGAAAARLQEAAGLARQMGYL